MKSNLVERTCDVRASQKFAKRNTLSFIHGSRSNSRDGFLSSGTRRNK